MDKKLKSKVKVVVRVRPPLKVDANICINAEGKNIHIVNHRNKNENLQYEFGSVYNETSTQQMIFTECVEPLLTNAFQGQNVSVFAYGPTGAGKTHTMLGVLSDPGIIPRTMKSLFNMIAEEVQTAEDQQTTPAQTTVTFSFLEIYNEKVQDLLKPGSNDLPIREDSSNNIFVAGITEKEIKNFDDFKNSFSPASSNRTVAATKLNEYSSRSHSILLLKICRRVQGRIFRGKIYLIDLAGSEDNRRTGNQGIRMKESAAINKSLFVLGEVVDAINQNKIRIPYRDSKLTRLLSDSIGGSCHSVMITNIAPEQHYYYDTYCTLNFATKSKKIVNTNTASIKDSSAKAVKPTAQLQPTKRPSDGDCPGFTKPKRPRKTSDVTAEVVPSPLLRRQEGFESEVNQKLAAMERLMKEMKDREAAAAMAQNLSEIKNVVSVKAGPKPRLASSVSTPTLRSPANRRRTYRVESVSPSTRRRRSSIAVPVSVVKQTQPTPKRRRSVSSVVAHKASKISVPIGKTSKNTKKISPTTKHSSAKSLDYSSKASTSSLSTSSSSVSSSSASKTTPAATVSSSASKTTPAATVSSASKTTPAATVSSSSSTSSSSSSSLETTAAATETSLPAPASASTTTTTTTAAVNSTKASVAKPKVSQVEKKECSMNEPSTSNNKSPNVIPKTPQVDNGKGGHLICPKAKVEEQTEVLSDKTNLLYQRSFMAKGKKSKTGPKKHKLVDELSFSPLFLDDKILKCEIITKAKASVADSPKTAKMKNAPYHFINDEQLSQNCEFLRTLNTASVKDLQKLQKVGVKRAQLIYDYRNINGAFDFVHDLEKIPGFTDKFIKSLLRANLVTDTEGNDLEMSL